ncbi:MAG TPA: HAMP domain-containing sensor histidine kinase [Candidatus Binatia bacterium]|jgi:signal transduction histidine kinase|nr:HAMP domain-containing sensor histidine kinase [Candidatus Binatia bacterium]
MRLRSLRGRLTLAFAATAFVAVGLSAVAIALMVEHALWAPIDAGLVEEASTLTTLLDIPHEHLLETVHALGAEDDLGPGKFVRVGSADGKTLARSRRVPPVVAAHRPTPLERMTLMTIGRERQVYRVVWSPTPHGGWVVLGVRANAQVDVVNVARATIAGVAVALILSLTLVAWSVTSRAVKEVARLADELETIEAGSLERRLTGRNTMEIDRLVNVLNRMLARLAVAVGQLQRFTADAAHELRTPIAALRAHIEVTLARATTPGALHDGLVDSLGQAERIGRLAEDLLTLSSVESRSAGAGLSLELVRIDELVQEAADFLKPIAEEQARSFACEIEAAPVVSGVPGLLKRVILNLIGNAFQHTGASATVRVRVDVVDGMARIAVADTGGGIPASLLPTVFDRFRHGEGIGAGTGLGLALVREIVAWHRGRVDLDASDQGTTVVVLLPLATSAS